MAALALIVRPPGVVGRDVRRRASLAMAEQALAAGSQAVRNDGRRVRRWSCIRRLVAGLAQIVGAPGMVGRYVLGRAADGMAGQALVATGQVVRDGGHPGCSR